MSMSGNAFAPAKHQRLVDIRPGSTVHVVDRQGGYDPYDGQVIEMKPEYGPTAIPALVILPDGSNQPTIVTDSGKWEVSVTIDSNVLSTDVPPAGLLLVQQKPVRGIAIQFLGGPEAAVAIIRWSGGTVRWEQGQPGQAERLVVPTIEGPLFADVGDYIIKDSSGSFRPVIPNAFQVQFEVVGDGAAAFQQDAAFQAASAQSRVPYGTVPEQMSGKTLAQQMADQNAGNPAQNPLGIPIG